MLPRLYILGLQLTLIAAVELIDESFQPYYISVYFQNAMTTKQTPFVDEGHDMWLQVLENV